MELDNLLATSEIESNPNSSGDRIAVNNWKQMRVRNRRMTMQAASTNSCWAMCTQKSIRRQSEIYQEHLLERDRSELNNSKRKGPT